MMHRSVRWYLTALLLISAWVHAADEASVHISAVTHEKIKVALCVIGTASHALQEAMLTIKSDLMFSNQCDVAIVDIKETLPEQSMNSLNAKGYELVLFVQYKKKGAKIAWSLWDVVFGVCAAQGEYEVRGMLTRCSGHTIADVVWPLITGEPGFFSSQIAYCKESGSKRGSATTICVADYDGQHERAVVNAPKIHVAPRFNSDTHAPMLYFSQYTDKNIRLMRIDARKRVRVVSDFDGINMLPSFSVDGTQAVYCASKGLGSCDIYCIEKGAGLTQITHNGANNFSPALSDDAQRIYYCSDVKSGVQQIYCYTRATGQVHAITALPGDAWSPAYHDKTQKLVYCKRVKGVVQLFVYNERAQTHQQRTFHEGHKDMCAWSPCGNYILFCKTGKEKMQLACFNILTGQERIITNVQDRCSFPTWSRLYDAYAEYF